MIVIIIIEIKYGNQLKKALNNINFSIDEGDFVLICGESGCGKSTLLRHLKPDESNIIFNISPTVLFFLLKNFFNYKY